MAFILLFESIIYFSRRWKISEFALFGSALRDELTPDSDIDVLVTFEEDARWSLFDFIEMKEELQKIFGREVDLLTKRAVEMGLNQRRKKQFYLQRE